MRRTSHSDSGCAGQVLLRMARRADRLSRESQGAPRAKGLDYARFLQDPDVDQYHFIARTSSTFTRFLAAMLKFAGAPYKVPDNVFVHVSSRLRREDVEVARHGISPDVYLDLGLDPSGCATTSPQSSTTRRDLDFNPTIFWHGSTATDRKYSTSQSGRNVHHAHFDGGLSLRAPETGTSRNAWLDDDRLERQDEIATGTRRASSARSCASHAHRRSRERALRQANPGSWRRPARRDALQTYAPMRSMRFAP